MDDRPDVLVVDDDSALRLLCRVNLELDGFAVREAASVADALAAIDERRPAVAFLDVHLGYEGSEQVLERLRAERIPVVVVTGSLDIDDYRPRADEMLGKPFSPTDLVAAARRLVTVGS